MDMENMGFFMMGGVVVASLLIYRIVDHMLTKYGGNGSRRHCCGDPAKLTKVLDSVDPAKLTKIIDAVSAVDLKEMERKTDEMYALHNVKDRDGVPIWYVRSSLEAALNKLITAIESQTMLMNVLIQEVRQDVKLRKKDD